VSEVIDAQDVRRRIAERLDPLREPDPAEALARATRPVRSLFDGPPKPAAVLVGLVERPHGFSVLLTRRADTPRKHTGQIAFPGGRCDAGETPWAAALREAEEEIGLEPRFVTVAGLASGMITGTGYLITPVVGFVAEGYRLKPNPDEVADIFETPFGFLMNPANHEEHVHEMENGDKIPYLAMTHDDRFIWGATAAILRGLYDRLYGVPLG